MEIDCAASLGWVRARPRLAAKHYRLNMENPMQPYDYPYREPGPQRRPAIWLPVAAVGVLLLLLIPSALFLYHYWPHGGTGLDPHPQPREVPVRGPLYNNEADLAPLCDTPLRSVGQVQS